VLMVWLAAPNASAADDWPPQDWPEPIDDSPTFFFITNELELGLRLRYEIVREFAPYVGFAWTRKLGGSSGLAREQGERAEELAFVAGVRLWF